MFCLLLHCYSEVQCLSAVVKLTKREAEVVRAWGMERILELSVSCAPLLLCVT